MTRFRTVSFALPSKLRASAQAALWLLCASLAIPAAAAPATPTAAAGRSVPFAVAYERGGTTVVEAADTEDPPPPAQKSWRPSIEIGGGYAWRAVQPSSVGRAFHRIENFYRAAGYTIRSADDAAGAGMAMSTVAVRLAPPIAVGLQFGRTHSSANDERLSGGLATIRVGARSPLAFEAGAGGGVCGFHFIRYYGELISPAGTTYTTLQNISLDGRLGYWTASGAATFQATPALSLQATAQYVGMSGVMLDTGPAGRVPIDLSGGMIGAAIVYAF